MPAPSEVVYKQFVLRHPTTRINTDADSLPTAILIRNGLDTFVACTVTKIVTGVYKVYVAIPSTYVNGDEIEFRVTATVATLTQSKIIRIGEVETRTTASPVSASNSYSVSYITSYDVGNIVYLKESAALGFLEAVRISGIYKRDNRWIYTVSARSSSPAAADHYGDHTSVVLGSVMYFTASEFIPLCDALDMIGANLQRQLTQIQSQRSSLCGTE